MCASASGGQTDPGLCLSSPAIVLAHELALWQQSLAWGRAELPVRPPLLQRASSDRNGKSRRLEPTRVSHRRRQRRHRQTRSARRRSPSLAHTRLHQMVAADVRARGGRAAASLRAAREPPARIAGAGVRLGGGRARGVAVEEREALFCSGAGRVKAHKRRASRHSRPDPVSV